MKTTRKSFYPCRRQITGGFRHLAGYIWTALALAAVIIVPYAGSAEVHVTASQQQTKITASGHPENGSTRDDEYKAYQAAGEEMEFIKRAARLMAFQEKFPNSKLLQPIDFLYMKMLNRDEYQAYQAAKMEPDYDKRAALLIEFLREYPNTRLMEKADYENIKPLEDQYGAYDAARQEPDLNKRAVMLIEFLHKYPKSVLVNYVSYEYMEMMKEASRSNEYDLLESLAKNWLKIDPKDKSVYQLVAESAARIRKYEECGMYLEEIFIMEPSSALAKEIYACYQRTENLDKQVEWAERLAKMPEFADDYQLYFDLMMKYANNHNLARAAEYARLTLKTADLHQRPDAKTKEQLQKVRRACYHVIAGDLMAKKSHAEAIAAFKEAVKAARYGGGYYGIGLCLDIQRDIEGAILYYAMAEMVGGEDAANAKDRLETLYRALHNNTLVGIDKVYQKAKESLAESAEEDSALTDNSPITLFQKKSHIGG